MYAEISCTFPSILTQKLFSSDLTGQTTVLAGKKLLCLTKKNEALNI